MKKKLIIFRRKGRAIRDWDISAFVDYIFNPDTKQSVFSISTQLVVDEIRARCREKTLIPDQFKILVEYKDAENLVYHFRVDENGRSIDWKDEFDTFSRIYMRIL